MAWRDPSEQISLIKRANNMKKLRGSAPPLSKHEQRCMQRIQARLLREYRALDEKDRAAHVSAEKWLQGIANSFTPQSPHTGRSRCGA